LCFDLTLRQLHSNTPRSKAVDLDQVMKTLFEKYAKVGLDQDGFLHVLKDLSGKDFTSEFKSWVHSTQELPVERLLELQGVEIRPEPSQWAHRLGLRLTDGSGPLVIKQVLKGGPAHACGLCPGDEWIGIEFLSKQSQKKHAWRIHKIEDWALYVQDQKEVTMVVSRDHRLLHIPMNISSINHTKTLHLYPKDMALIAKWLTA
jgi:predicted metalloprotease with PDZ domain